MTIMNKDRILVITIVALLLLGVSFLCVSIFGNDKGSQHPLPIALSCIFSANALIMVRNKKKNRN